VIAIASGLSFVLWCGVILFWKPVDFNSLVDMQANASLLCVIFFLTQAVYIFYCLLLLRWSKAVPQHKPQWNEIRVNYLFLSLGILFLIGTITLAISLQLTKFNARLIFLPINYLALYSLKVDLFLIICKFTPVYTVHSQVQNNSVYLSALTESGREQFSFYV